jgi:3D (Asp-Asp-Asp) domain-containing protein
LKRRKKEIDVVVSDLRSQKSRLVASRAEREGLLASAGAQSGDVQQQSQRVEAKIDQMNPPNSKGRHTGRFLTMVATAYSPEEPGLTDHTATGLKAQYGVCAVDPSVIPLGTRLHVEGYGYAIAADTGSAIKGNRIDLCFDTLAECNAYGRHTVKVEILD